MSTAHAPAAAPPSPPRLGVRALVARFAPQVATTWAVTLLEVGLVASLPLLMGRAIDGLLARDAGPFGWLGLALLLLTVLGTLRRLYDTRVYGEARRDLADALARRSEALPAPVVDARLRMSRELVDFVEHEVPEALTAVLRLLAGLAVLLTFGWPLAAAALVACAASLLACGAFHERFFRLNGVLNELSEQQVDAVRSRSRPRLARHLGRIRDTEVALSDTEALVYGVVFDALVGLLLVNLWLATQTGGLTAGGVFSVVTYSWEFAESTLMLPMALQSLARVDEVTERINATEG